MMQVDFPLHGSLAKRLGLVARIDASELHTVSPFKWYAVQRNRSATFYAATGVWDGEKKRTMYMHRVIMGAEAGQQVDHRDHDGLNNCRGNLRLCTQTLNNANTARDGALVGASGYRGVHRKYGGRRYYAGISIGRRNVHLGSFLDPSDAAKAYDEAARAAFGEFATLNFPVSPELV